MVRRELAKANRTKYLRLSFDLVWQRIAEIEYVHTIDATLVLDRNQLRDITLEDDDLMREMLATLIEDTSKQLVLLDSAIREQDSDRCKRLAHYCKGACANVGANAAADVLHRMELQAQSRNFSSCAESLATLGGELQRLILAAESL